MLIVLPLLLSLVIPQPPSPCSGPEYRQFDFWLGRWEVTDRTGKIAGTNEIRRVHGGCALTEHWTSVQGTTGSSINMYVAATKVWHQTWSDSGGTLLVMEGGLRDGAMHLSGTAYSPRGGPSLSRITWTPNPDGSVRQLWEASRDEGKTWTVVFDGRYVKLDEPAAEAANLAFHSDPLMNLHHTLYAAAWDGRPQAGTGQALAGALPSPLDAPMAPADRKVWEDAVRYYDAHVASTDLLFGRGMWALKMALVRGNLRDPAVRPELRGVLEAALPVYRKYFWTAHDRINRAWIEDTVRRLREIAPEVIARLTKLYTVAWFDGPVRIDAVWVANRQGAYATEGPTHATISTAAREGASPWTPVETVFHEVSHTLIRPIEAALATALDDRADAHGALWHVVQFYVTGAVVRQVLEERDITYVPYMYATGLFDRAWSQYRPIVERHWQPYVEGRTSLQEAVNGTVRDLPPRSTVASGRSS